MSGHSKWSKIKHQKESTDAAKGKIFTKMANAIIMAVVNGGGNKDPETNFKLRLTIDRARSVNMPKDKIEKAIERGSGNSGGANFEEVVYEAFGPAGVGIIIEAATDNKQRTVSEIKNILERNGGVLASSGAVSHSFLYVGKIEIEKTDKSYDLVLEKVILAGAIDMQVCGETYDIYTQASEVHKIKDVLVTQGLKVLSVELIYKPQINIYITDKSTAKNLLNLLTIIEENDNVQKVHANFDIPEEFFPHL